jgi:ribA/ribD-fused uncharacterized protein
MFALRESSMDSSNTLSGPIFFYGHTSPFSNFYRRPFVVKKVNFFHREGFIMFCKAMLFGDRFAAEKILTAYRPIDAKELGRMVQGFDQRMWESKVEGYAVEGCIAQFGQHPDMLSHLMRTGDRELVEASPTDRIWGIGMAADNPRIMERALWGNNKQGRILMRTREYFRTGV